MTLYCPYCGGTYGSKYREHGISEFAACPHCSWQDPGQEFREIPNPPFEVKNGDWRCRRCGKELGVSLPRDGNDKRAEYNIPEDCPTPVCCKEEMLETALSGLGRRPPRPT